MSSNKNSKVDPRIIRTKRMFKEALISLLEENVDKSKLTVQSIADRAELNRATFYLHYRDIEDLMEQIIEEVLAEMSNTITPSPVNQQSIGKGNRASGSRLISFLEHIHQNAGLYQVLLENKEFRKRVFGILLDIVSLWGEDRKAKGRSFKVPNEIIVSSSLGIVSWWLAEGTPYSSSYLAKQIVRMV
ncbi:TetR/AcrR family transcriptional regulator [Neobacillus jeddahensis]|uniref:TetR/AcrR family transcriptional regulator n=1 Tax=Neobacillus jeddahensis TaxID=1461580 RepID=UPI00058BD19B|nr:TetR/AcrR family transcriptional regulator [Neobacillus jeddahensis]